MRREFSLSPMSFMLSVLFTPVSAFYAWIISSRKPVGKRRRMLWIGFVLGTAVTYALFLTVAIRIDPAGYVPVLGSMVFFVVGLFLLGASVLVSRNLVENPHEQLEARVKRAAIMLSLTVTVPMLITVFRVIFQAHGR